MIRVRHMLEAAGEAVLLCSFEYPIRLRWGEHAEEGFWGETTCSPKYDQIFFIFDTPSACGG
ncbi:MAG: hypothetical protein Q8N95_05075, partial [Desulfobacterales bacterium]|nr:hypothetical protein [Desulfobacterales bacterium]